MKKTTTIVSVLLANQARVRAKESDVIHGKSHAFFCQNIYVRFDLEAIDSIASECWFWCAN